MNCDEVKPLLNAHVDDELDLERRAAVAAHLETCADCAADLEKLSSVRRSIQNEMPYYKAPPELRDGVKLALSGAEYLDSKSRPTNWRLWGAVAAGIALCVLAAAPFFLNQRNKRQLVAEEFLSAHQRALMGRSMDVVSSDRHTVKPWFNGKLPFSPPVIDLRPDGFPLEGGRVDYAGGRTVAVLVYSRALHRIDVFVSPAGGASKPPQRFQRNGYNEIFWTRNDFLFIAVSDLNEPELSAFVQLLQTR